MFFRLPRQLLWISVALSLAACGGEAPTGPTTLSTPPGAYYPSWNEIAPEESLSIGHDSLLSDTENGGRLREAIEGLSPGQMLVVGAGTYAIDGFFDLQAQGRRRDPIWIVAAGGSRPVLTRPNPAGNTINFGVGGTPVQYLALRGFEITGGIDLIRLGAALEVWIDDCVLHGSAGNGISANTLDAARLYITRNEIYAMGSPGQGIVLGADFGATTVTNSVVALNHVHDLTGQNGHGIAVKHGSFGNRISDNRVTDTNGSSIVVFGNGGAGFNWIERNACSRAGANALFVEGDAVVHNNLLVASTGPALLSQANQALPNRVEILHNTVVNGAAAVELLGWSNREDMVLANNVLYSRDGNSIRFATGSNLVQVAGNVVAGAVVGVSDGFVVGTGLGDFIALSWDGEYLDGTPSSGSPIVGAGHSSFGLLHDISGVNRLGSLEAGAFDHR